jgi:hypothetical protein
LDGELIQLENLFVRALTSKNEPSLLDLVSEDFCGLSPEGFSYSKVEWVAGLLSSPITWSLERGRQKFIHREGCSISIASWETEGHFDGFPSKSHINVITTWAREAGGMKLLTMAAVDASVAKQWTQLEEAAAASSAESPAQ